jgi:hypothetical protein
MMFVVLAVSKNVDMLNKLKDSLKEKYPLIPFDIREPEAGKYQLRLNGDADDTQPRLFVKDFIADFTGQKKPTKKIKEDSKEVNNEELSSLSNKIMFALEDLLK